VAGRGGNGKSGDSGDRVIAFEPGAFLLPGLIKYESPFEVPNANPAAAIPTVPTAHNYKTCQTSHNIGQCIYRSDMLLTLFHLDCILPSRRLYPEVLVNVHKERPHDEFTISCKGFPVGVEVVAVSRRRIRGKGGLLIPKNDRRGFDRRGHAKVQPGMVESRGPGVIRDALKTRDT
jgi:hypothetical protein